MKTVCKLYMSPTKYEVLRLAILIFGYLSNVLYRFCEFVTFLDQPWSVF